MEEQLKIFLSELLNKSISPSRVFKRNLLKEYLQILVLDFIYSHKDYSQLVFYGGSCLSHCYGLPRLSEDLDFVDLKKEIKLKELAKELASHLKEKFNLDVKILIQKFRLYLKFSMLKELGLAEKGESDLLFLKIEIFSQFDFCPSCKVEMAPLFKFNKSLLVRVFDLSTLMATKIQAVLRRKWIKTGKNGEILARVKGRDYFDLLWYLDKGIKPNLACLEDKKMADLKKTLAQAVGQVDEKSIQIDLEPLIADANFVNNLSKNLKEILQRKIREM